jgi:hypothetical protein
LLESKLLWRPEIKESWLRQTGDILPQCLYVRWPQEAVMDRVVSKIDLLWPLSSNRSGAVIGWVGGGWWSHPHLGTASPMPEDHCGGRILNKCLVECMVSTSQLCWGFTGYNWEFWAQVWKITGWVIAGQGLKAQRPAEASSWLPQLSLSHSIQKSVLCFPTPPL